MPPGCFYRSTLQNGAIRLCHCEPIGPFIARLRILARKINGRDRQTSKKDYCGGGFNICCGRSIAAISANSGNRGDLQRQRTPLRMNGQYSSKSAIDGSFGDSLTCRIKLLLVIDAFVAANAILRMLRLNELVHTVS